MTQAPGCKPTPCPDWLRAPLLLSADNFTPLTRTPWGGQVIGERYKHGVVASARGQRIGESWEFSCDPAFPSHVLDEPAAAVKDRSLLALIERYPEAVLSPELVAKSGAHCEILVKLLDAAEPLSLQVHPADGDTNLRPGECGKPESWLVLAAAPGAGIYLGFARPLSRTALKQALLATDAAAALTMRELLHFVPVQPGDYFEIEPGVTHAIGAGVTLLEPQRILTGQSGKTYRLWDWQRRYASDGQLDLVHGTARPLHVDESLALIDPERQVGAAFVATLSRTPRLSELPGGVSLREFPANPYYKTALCRMPAGSRMTLRLSGGYAAFVALSGHLAAAGKNLPAGQPALLPHAAMPLTFTSQVDSEFAIVVPQAAVIGT